MSIAKPQTHEKFFGEPKKKKKKNPEFRIKAAQSAGEKGYLENFAKQGSNSQSSFSSVAKSSWQSYKPRKPNLSVSITTDPNSKRLRIHEGPAKAESSLATQICAEKNRAWLTFFTGDVYPLFPRRRARAGGTGIRRSILLCSCPLYDVGGRGAVGSPADEHNLVSPAQTLKSITSRLMKTGFLVQYLVAAEQLYGQ